MATEIRLFGRVGSDFDAKTVADLLAESSGEVTLRLNSSGGNLFEALAINTALQRHPGGVTIEIEGACLSAANVIAAAGTRVRVAQGALLMLHTPSNLSGGTALELASSIQMLERGTTAMIDILHEKTRLTKHRIREMLRAETWLDANESVKLGFCDEVIASTIGIAASAVDLATHWHAAVERCRADLQSSKRWRVTRGRAMTEAWRRYPALHQKFISDANAKRKGGR